MSSMIAVAPTATAVRLFDNNPNRKAIVIANVSATVDAYLGFTSAVTSATGFPLSHGMQWNDDVTDDAYWVVTAGGTGAIRAIEITA